MTGKIIMESTPIGIGVDVELRDIDLLSKCECMHALAEALQMGEEEMSTYLALELAGVMREAAETTACETAEQIQAMLKGESSPGVAINLTELRRQAHES